MQWLLLALLDFTSTQPVYCIVLFPSMKGVLKESSLPLPGARAQQASPEGHSQECPPSQTPGLPYPPTASLGPHLSVPSPEEVPTKAPVSRGPQACHTSTGDGPRPASPLG